MSENERLTDAERVRIKERAKNHFDESARHLRAAMEDLKRIWADDALREIRDGDVIDLPRREPGASGEGPREGDFRPSRLEPPEPRDE